MYGSQPCVLGGSDSELEEDDFVHKAVHIQRIAALPPIRCAPQRIICLGRLGFLTNAIVGAGKASCGRISITSSGKEHWG